MQGKSDLVDSDLLCFILDDNLDSFVIKGESIGGRQPHPSNYLAVFVKGSLYVDGVMGS